MKTEQDTSRGSILGNKLRGQVSSEDKGMMHKSKTAKDGEVVGEQNGVMHSAFFSKKAEQSYKEETVSKANQGEFFFF